MAGAECDSVSFRIFETRGHHLTHVPSRTRILHEDTSLHRRSRMYWVHPDGPREGLVLDPYLEGGHVQVRAAYRSAAYILRAALCDELDVDPSELEIVNLAPIAVADQRLGRIILSDKNPNGSGYAVALRDRLSDIMAVIRGEEAHGEWAWLRLLSDPASAHDQACRTSCTECIRYYTNQGEHGLMDWRLTCCC